MLHKMKYIIYSRSNISRTMAEIITFEFPMNN